MRDYTFLLLSAEKKKHHLTVSLWSDDAESLINHLRHTLEITDNELDLSPKSLKKLEENLIFLQAQGKIEDLSDDDALRLIRELAAYIGTVLTLHGNGTWVTLTSLWNTYVDFNEVIVEKASKKYVAPKLGYSLGNIAAITLDKINRGIKPNLYKYYLSAIKKRFVEK